VKEPLRLRGMLGCKPSGGPSPRKGDRAAPAVIHTDTGGTDLSEVMFLFCSSADCKRNTPIRNELLTTAHDGLGGGR
jgi:hypothetical protein